MSFFEEDPAADFLSREQAAIGDVLGGDNFELIADNQVPPEQGLSLAEQGLDFLAEDDAPVYMPPAPSETEILGEPIMSEPEIVGAPVMNETIISAPPPAAPEKTGPVYDALSEAAEPESIRLWRAEQEEEIKARDAEAAARTDEWRAEAQKELENWHSKQNEVLVKNKEANREAQEEFLKECQEQKPGAQWEKICKLCDFNPKSNRNLKDTSRMRSLFLQLKQNPPVRA